MFSWYLDGGNIVECLVGTWMGDILAEQNNSSQHRKYECLGPYHVESTSSRPITEVKQR